MKKTLFFISISLLASVMLVAFKPIEAQAQEQAITVNNSPTNQIPQNDFRFSVPGTIKHLPAENSACGLLIETQEGLLEVVDMPDTDFQFFQGGKLIISYEIQDIPAHCGASQAVILYDFDMEGADTQRISSKNK